jgi:hypothetical protein
VSVANTKHVAIAVYELADLIAQFRVAGVVPRGRELGAAENEVGVVVGGREGIGPTQTRDPVVVPEELTEYGGDRLVKASARLFGLDAIHDE